MSLKELCATLQQCADKLEEEIKFTINDIQNIISSNGLNETKTALEKAKDYHYKEILDSISDILKSIRKMLFHQDKIEWLSYENVSKNDLKRFSYVKRQIYEFSKTQDTPTVPTQSIKKEQRRSASEISIGSLEAWEKYLDQKEKEEKQIEDKVVDLKPLVPKRTLSNARRRKKFVSSTLGGFLEEDERKSSLDSIFEDNSSIEENEELSYSRSLESLDTMILSNDKNVMNDVSEGGSKKSLKKYLGLLDGKNTGLKGSLESLYNMTYCDKIDGNIDCTEKPNNNIDYEENKLKLLDSSTNNPEDLKKDLKFSSNMIDFIDSSTPKDNITINEIKPTFSDLTSPVEIAKEDSLEKQSQDNVKPKIIDVVYKKDPS